MRDKIIMADMAPPLDGKEDETPYVRLGCGENSLDDGRSITQIMDSVNSLIKKFKGDGIIAPEVKPKNGLERVIERLKK